MHFPAGSILLSFPKVITTVSLSLSDVYLDPTAHAAHTLKPSRAPGVGSRVLCIETSSTVLLGDTGMVTSPP